MSVFLILKHGKIISSGYEKNKGSWSFPIEPNFTHIHLIFLSLPTTKNFQSILPTMIIKYSVGLSKYCGISPQKCVALSGFVALTFCSVHLKPPPWGLSLETVLPPSCEASIWLYSKVLAHYMQDETPGPPSCLPLLPALFSIS